MSAKPKTIWNTLFTLYFVMQWIPVSAMAGMIHGFVSEMSSGDSLPGVSVEIVGEARGSITGADGQYRLENLRPGSYTLKFSHLGFADKVIENISLEDSTTVELHCVLTARPIPMDHLEVLGEQTTVPDIQRVPTFVTVLVEEDFGNQSTSVSEVLSSATGVQVKQMGGLGAFSSISIRGSSAEQVDVYLDGIPLNAAMGGGVDLSNLPLSQIEQIEVYRGAGANNGGIGGAVHIRTRTAEKGVNFGAQMSMGSFGTRSANGMLSSRSSTQEFLVIGDITSSANSFDFLDDNGAEYNKDDDVITSRRNGDFLSASLLGKWKRRLRKTSEVHFQANYFWKHHGIPGISNNQSEHARLDLFRGLMEAGLRMSNWLDRFSVAQTIFYSRKIESFRDKAGEVGVGRQDNRNRTSGFGWRSALKSPFYNTHVISVDVSLGREVFEPEERLQPDARMLGSRRWTAGARGSVDWGLPRNNGTLTTAMDVKRQKNHLVGENPYQLTLLAPDTTTTYELLNLRAGLRLDLGHGIWVKSSLGRSHRAPSFYELFGDRGGVIGNTDLLAERGTAWDVGLRIERKGAVLEAAYFGQRFDNLIQFVQFSQGVGRAQNIGKARVSGLETTVSAKLLRSWSWSGNYTFQQARDRSSAQHRNGKLLPNRPKHECHVHTGYDIGPWHGFYDYTFSAGNFLDRANLRPISNRHIHNAGVRIKAWRQVRITVEAKNLLGNQIADLWGYPLPGRSYFVTVQEGF